jgi:hypothetical protein
LEVNPNRRASLMEVQKILDSYWGGESVEQSRAKSNTSKGPTEPLPESNFNTLCEKNSNRIPESSQKKPKEK